jgi:uncharacterized protein YndB with AHSA1/START domain
MSISFEHGIDIALPPDRVFALLDDISQTPKWLASCKEIERVTAGPSEVGSRFQYSYQEGMHSGKMEGVITMHIPGQRLSMTYQDSLAEVSVDFRMSPTGAGTWLIHTIAITPKTFFARMFSPIIQSRLPGQTIEGMNALRKLAEAQSP